MAGPLGLLPQSRGGSQLPHRQSHSAAGSHLECAVRTDDRISVGAERPAQFRHLGSHEQHHRRDEGAARHSASRTAQARCSCRMRSCMPTAGDWLVVRAFQQHQHHRHDQRRWHQRHAAEGTERLWGKIVSGGGVWTVRAAQPLADLARACRGLYEQPPTASSPSSSLASPIPRSPCGSCRSHRVKIRLRRHRRSPL